MVVEAYRRKEAGDQKGERERGVCVYRRLREGFSWCAHSLSTHAGYVSTHIHPRSNPLAPEVNWPEVCAGTAVSFSRHAGHPCT